MNLQEIKALIDAMAASDLSEMALTRDGIQLRLVRKKGGTAAAATQAGPPTPTSQPPAKPVATATPRQVAAPVATPVAPAANEITTPLYGVVHWRPSPDAPPFVAAGQSIQAGQVVCVVEAMKVFNEIRAENDATVQALLVESGQEVEAGQPLLRLG
ncbi:acetyl-CoA carboxylase biotin carboxyl carrier protein [Variovorax sp. HJSM1_2]|uniref:acetyl-CoA carboxylase biotin carboxyl carrier protein n=1 Tax=Variovorax sp. HJSM1_2 TaxID=3366263 RepID=UPI003BB9CF13